MNTMTKLRSVFDQPDPDDLAGVNQRTRDRFAHERSMGPDLTLDTLESGGHGKNSFSDERKGFRGEIDHLVLSLGED